MPRIYRMKLLSLMVLLVTGINFGCSLSPEVNRTDHVQAVVSTHHLATEAGIKILDMGGTAADAAVAVASVLSVVEPYFSSVLGGGTWALYYDAKSRTVSSLDGVGPVGSLATVDDYKHRALEYGMHQAVVPGAWDGWMLWLKTYGVLDLDVVLEPAILIARNGYPVNGQMNGWLQRFERVIGERPDAKKIYMPDGEILQRGEIVYQIDMANTLEKLTEVYLDNQVNGRNQSIDAVRDYYYRGPLAEEMVHFSDLHDGYLTLADFNGFSAEIVPPISIQYNQEIQVFENPPNSQGITMLLALNILKGYEFANMQIDSPDCIHLQVEALKLAFADRYHYIGDPKIKAIPIDMLLSDRYADNQRARIQPESVMVWPIDGGLDYEPDLNNTTTFHIVDRHGNAAAVTTSLGAEFCVVGTTGIHINNRMRMISLTDVKPNLLTPGKKVRHTSNPYLALKNGSLYLLGGNTGADNQSQCQVQQFLAVVEFGKTAQQAVSQPRFTTMAFPAGTFPYQVRNVLAMHQDFPQSTITALQSIGHAIVADGTFGNAGMIVISDNGYQGETGAEPSVDTALGVVWMPVSN